MNNFSRALAALALLAAVPAAAAPHGGFGGGAPHGGVGGGHFGGMPPHGFHGSPPGFHGSIPHGSGFHGGVPHGAFGGHHGGVGHDLGLFHGHGYSGFSPAERGLWQHGAWRHTWHDGHLGWWWLVGNAWFYYPAPIYPYPLYVGPDYYYDYYDEFGTPDHYWYYCDNPQGYYPNVTHCDDPWQVVPPDGE